MKNSSPQQNTEFTPLNIYGNVHRISLIFRIFTSIILISLVVGIIILLSSGDWLQAVIIAAALPFVLIGYFYVRRQKFEEAASFLAVIMLLIITIISTSGLGVHNLSNIGFPAILIVASLVTRKKSLVFITIFAIACCAWLVFGEIYGLYTPHDWVRSVPGDFFTLATTLVATAIMVRVLTEALFQSSQDLQKELKERKNAEERLAYDSLHDALTGLPNRTLFNDRLSQKLEHARRHPQDLFAVMFMDLDRFKVINDSLGHTVGDQLLIAAADHLKHCLRPEDTVSRMGGDEFAILLNDLADISDAVRIAERIQQSLNSASMIEVINRITTASIGIAIYNGRYTKAQEMLRDADAAMYRAKSMGAGHFKVFDKTMYNSAMALLQMEEDLKQANETRQWEVYYQPIISMPQRRIVGFEALVRWHHPQRGVINPDDFIQVAEDTGLILPMGEFVLREACRQARAWQKKEYPDCYISVNLSGRQFQDRNLIRTIENILQETGINGRSLQLEITESVAMKDYAYSAKILNHLNRLGIQIALDDFGHGYSSLAYLNRFPIRILKIDRSFIKNIDQNRNNREITTAIISLAHSLNLEVVAEGVESEKELALLGSISCDKVQGNLISNAAPVKKLEKLALKNTRST
jgi:diguanylate cyclase (GGDEF)-like protein